MKRSTGVKFTRIGMFHIPGRSNATNHETLIFSFISLYVTDQICETTVIKAVPHRNVSAKKKKKSEGNQNIKPDDGKNWQNILHITASKIVYECSILMATKGGQGDSICSWCTTQNDFHVLHSWQSITGRKCNANQSSSHICRDQGRRNHSLWLLWGVKGGCIWLQQAKLDWYMQCAHVARPWYQQTIMKTHTKTR